MSSQMLELALTAARLDVEAAAVREFPHDAHGFHSLDRN
jgi:hypothetical protein